MSLIVSLKVSDGIVMAADSRVSMQVRKDDDLRGVMGICHYSDTYHKLYLAKNGAGISFCGEMAIEKGNLSHFLECFLNEKVTEAFSVKETAEALLEYMKSLPKIPASIFHVCGYEGDCPVLYRVLPKKDTVENLAAKPLVWDGEGDILARILSPVAMRTPDGKGAPLPDFPLALNLFTLQDAVDFADYAVRTTVETMRFQLRAKTVGGNVDLLVLRPDGPRWICQKTLGEPK
ncbi:MAG: hypothetical protein IIY02_02060 [Firmicutes bacterium]|nr:hypothetical protein [Bacillota bacterium]